MMFALAQMENPSSRIDSASDVMATVAQVCEN